MNWIKEIEKSEFSNELKTKLLKYVTLCTERNIPIIFNLQHLAIELGINYQILKNIVNSSQSFYYEFEIPKRSGGKRKISSPYPSLAYIQRWILDNIIYKFSPHNSATAYQPKKSIVTHVRPHVYNEYVYFIDLKDFFPSITIDRIKSVFERIGYPDHISYFFSKLCLLHDSIPQGAPSSPAICNLVAYDLDLLISRLCDANNLVYTRYADDICVSATYDFSEKQGEIIEIIEKNNFRVNDRKVRYIKGFGKNKIVTGISIGSGQIKLPRKTKRKWRIEIHQIAKYGINHHMQVNEIKDPIYLNRCIGKLYYWKMIEPDNLFVLNSITKLEKMNAGNR